MTTEKLITSAQTDRIADLGKVGIKTAVRKVTPTSANAQTGIIAQGDVFQKRVEEAVTVIIRDMTTPNKYASQVEESSYNYPHEFHRLPYDRQVIILAKELNFEAQPLLEKMKRFAGTLNALPFRNHPEDGNFAIVSPFGLMKLVKGFKDPFDPELYCQGLLRLFEVISKKRSFTNYQNGQIDANHLRQTMRTLEAYRTIANEQGESPIWIIPVQLGFLHRGESINRAREIFTGNEFGLGSVAGTSIAITHPERFVRNDELDMDLPGDEFSPGADGIFSEAPVSYFGDDELKFDAYDVSVAGAAYGSASCFLSQS